MAEAQNGYQNFDPKVMLSCMLGLKRLDFLNLAVDLVFSKRGVRAFEIWKIKVSLKKVNSPGFLGFKL